MGESPGAADEADRAPQAVRGNSTRVPAAENVLRILSYLAGQRGPVAAATVAQALGLPRSSTYHLLVVLEQQGFVAHFPESRRFGLGLAAFELSSGYLRHEPLARLGAPVLATLVDRIGESAHLAVLQGRDVIYVVEERARNRPALVTDVGVRLPSHLTASGRAMLAHLPPAQLRALFPDAAAFAHRGDEGPRSYGELRRTLDDVRSRGYGFEDGEVSTGVSSVAVAVTDQVGWPVAAVAVTFPTESLDAADWPDLARRIATYSGELARRVHGRSAPGIPAQ